MAFRDSVDVLVVGGGPAGLMAAYAAASGGCSTLLVEREDEIGDPVHTSGATTVRTMQRFGIPAELYHVVNRLRMCSPGEAATFQFDDSVGCVIDVRRVYRHLAQRAVSKGVKILTATSARDPVLEGGFVTGCRVDSRTEGPIDVRSKVLIDASGYHASISKQAGLHPGFTRFGVGAEYELRAPHCRQDEVVLVVGNRYAPSGYAWVAPWGGNRVRAGVGILHADSRADPKAHLETFLKEAGGFDVDLSESLIEEYHYGIIPSDGLPRQFAGPGIMAVGDAAGQATLVVGEGIRLSLEAGEMAGQTAARAITKGVYTHKRLMPYERWFRSRYQRKLSIGHRLNLRMAAWDDDDWDKKVRVLQTMPPRLFVNLVQSEFPVFGIGAWIGFRPQLWVKGVVSVLKVLRHYLRGRHSTTRE